MYRLAPLFESGYPMTQPLRVLVVDGGEQARDFWFDALVHSGDRNGCALTHERDVGPAASRLWNEPFDAAVVSIESGGLASLCRFMNESPGVATITAVESPDFAGGLEAVKLGAQDFWIPSDMSPGAMRRGLHCAVVRYRMLDEVRNRVAAAQEVRAHSDPPRWSAETTTALRMNTLRVGMPSLFEQLVDRYAQQLERAFEARLYREDHHDEITAALLAIACELAVVYAGPRDVVEVHTTSVKRMLASVSGPRATVYVEESRLLALELMGHLASRYRNACQVNLGLVRKANPARRTA